MPQTALMLAAQQGGPEAIDKLLCKLVVGGRTEWIFATPHCWHIAALNGKGLGVVATRIIGRGERIMAESPLATCSKHPRRRQDARVFARAVDRLLPAQRAAFYDLSQSELVYGTRKTAEGVWRSNAFPTVEHDDGRTEAAVFAQVCRLNHACAPNAHVAWSMSRAEQTVHAIREIAAGDEITVSYAAPGTECAARRLHLRNTFGFECDCSLCALTGAEMQASDVRQARLGELSALLARSPSSGASSAQTVGLVTEKLHLLKAEGLPVEWAHMDMVTAFTSCCCRGEFALARLWMQQAIEAAQTMLGKDSKVVQDLESILQQR